MVRDLSMQSRRQGKSEKVRIATDIALDAGKTVIVCNADGATKWKRVRRKGRVALDVVEEVKRDPDFVDG